RLLGSWGVEAREDAMDITRTPEVLSTELAEKYGRNQAEEREAAVAVFDRALSSQVYIRDYPQAQHSASMMTMAATKRCHDEVGTGQPAKRLTMTKPGTWQGHSTSMQYATSVSFSPLNAAAEETLAIMGQKDIDT